MPLSRRTLIASVLTAAALPRAMSAQPASSVVEGAQAFLGTLDPDRRERATFAFGDESWRGWNYFGAGGFIKPGLRLEEMDAAQREAAWGMLATILSPEGLAKAQRVMDLQDVLMELGSTGRSSLRFSVAVFGEPSATGVFGLRLEGHHLSLSYTVRAVRFAWTGGNEPGTRFGYRVIGETFVIELGAVDDKALHLHTIWHDRETVLGRNV
jgi:hypothetical protein